MTDIKLVAHLPLWYQIAQGLQYEIAERATRGELRLPTEADLAKRFGVSLLTLRQALDFLQEKGLLERKRKLGTFIRPEAIREKRSISLGSIENVFTQQGSDRVDILEYGIVDTPPDLQPIFKGQDRVCRMVRLRYHEDVPTDLAVNHVRRDVAHAIPRAILKKLPVTQAIHEKTGFKIGHVRQEFEAAIASPEVAAQLGIEPLSAVMILVGSTFDDAGGLIDHARIVYRGDNVRFALTYDA